jgi:chemotaxis protein MotB
MAGKRDKKGSGRAVIIVRKMGDGGAAGHHGGAWKVAYADFVTAMMAFFLLMWLLNATTEAQRKGLADYFSPTNQLSHASSGTGQPFGGHTAFDEGAMVSDRGSVEIHEGNRPPADATVDGDPQVQTRARKRPEDTDTGATDINPDPDATQPVPAGRVRNNAEGDLNGDRQPNRAEIRAEQDRQEKAAFAKAADEIRTAVAGDPALSDLAKQLAIDMTPEGLRIQLMDEDKLPMFTTGSAVPNDRARALIQKIAPVLQKLPEAISIAGYTDATPYAGAGKTNWELSSDRANATRRLLTDGGLTETRIRTVTGHADRDPLVPSDPLAAANRRIAIVVLRATQVQPAAGRPADPAAQQPADHAPLPADHASLPAERATRSVGQSPGQSVGQSPGQSVGQFMQPVGLAARPADPVH